MVPSILNRTHPLDRLRDDMDRLFGQIFEDLPVLGRDWLSASTFPAVNLWEDDTKVYAEAELPGVKMDDIEVSVVGNELTIKGERKNGAMENATYHRRERGIGTFSRVFRLPVEIEVDQVEATLRNGVLLVTLPKAESARPRKVQVRALPK